MQLQNITSISNHILTACNYVITKWTYSIRIPTMSKIFQYDYHLFSSMNLIELWNIYRKNQGLI